MLQVRPARDDDLPAVAALLEDGFARFIAQDYDTPGRVAFRMYAAERAVWARLHEGALGLVGCLGQRIVGYAELQGRGRVMTGRDHLSLLFIEPALQRRGIARQLLAEIRIRLSQLPEPPDSLTVHAAPRAVPAYLRLGFLATGPEAVTDGVRAVPMSLLLRRPTGRAGTGAVPAPTGFLRKRGSRGGAS